MSGEKLLNVQKACHGSQLQQALITTWSVVCCNQIGVVNMNFIP